MSAETIHAPAKPKLLDCNMKDISLHTSCSTRTPRLSKKKKMGVNMGVLNIGININGIV